MKKQDKHVNGSASAAYNAVAANFQRRLERLETFLKLNLPCVPIVNRPRADRQRAVLGWDGLRIVLTKQADLPLLRAEDLNVAIDGLIDDVQVALNRAAIQVVAGEAALVKAQVG